MVQALQQVQRVAVAWNRELGMFTADTVRAWEPVPAEQNRSSAVNEQLWDGTHEVSESPAASGWSSRSSNPSVAACRVKYSRPFPSGKTVGSAKYR